LLAIRKKMFAMRSGDRHHPTAAEHLEINPTLASTNF